MRHLIWGLRLPLALMFITGVLTIVTPWWFCLLPAIGTLVLAYDVSKRFDEYVHLVLTQEDYNHKRKYRHMQKMRYSMCQRHIAIVVYGWEAEEYYDMLGYKWYHITPDAGLHTMTFWKGFFK